MSLTTSTEIFTFYADKIIIHNQNYNPTYQAKKSTDWPEKNNNEKYTGIVTNYAEKKIYQILNNWLISLKIYQESHNNQFNPLIRKPNFITLTIPGTPGPDHKKIKRNLLQPFIKQITRNYDIRHYFWKSELQARGAIHFHLICDNYIDKKVIQVRWNKILKNNSMLDDHFEKFGNYMPPSTHVRKIDNIIDQINYGVKYVSKNKNDQKINGKVYDVDKKLRDLPKMQIDKNLIDTLKFREFLNTTYKKVIETDWVKIVQMKSAEYYKILPPDAHKLFLSHYLKIFDHLYN